MKTVSNVVIMIIEIIFVFSPQLGSTKTQKKK